MNEAPEFSVVGMLCSVAITYTITLVWWGFGVFLASAALYLLSGCDHALKIPESVQASIMFGGAAVHSVVMFTCQLRRNR